MLVLTRKPGQSVIIGARLQEIRVVNIREGTVRICLINHSTGRQRIHVGAKGSGFNLDDDMGRVKIVEASGNRVRLGFNAPRYVTILRDEIYSAPKPTSRRRRPKAGSRV